MKTGLNIYTGASGQAKGDGAGLVNNPIVDSDLSSKMAGLDQAVLGSMLGMAGTGAGFAISKARSLWSLVRAGGVIGSAGSNVAIASARGAATVGVVGRVAAPVAVVAEVAHRGYKCYKIEKQHDSVEDAHAKGLVDAKTMDMVTEERNAGHARNVAGGVGGLAGAWAGFKVGGAIGVAGGALTGPGAVVFSPLLGVVGAVSGAVAGYYAGSKLAEGASDMITGHDSSYKHTQQALENLNSSKASISNENAGQAWAKAKERSSYQAILVTPGLSDDLTTQRHFSSTLSSTAGSPAEREQSPNVSTPLSKGGASESKRKQRARDVSRSHL